MDDPDVGFPVFADVVVAVDADGAEPGGKGVVAGFGKSMPMQGSQLLAWPGGKCVRIEVR